MTFIRCFDGQILDMLECSVQHDTARSLSQFGGPKCPVGTKPLLSFSGPQFEDADRSSKYTMAKNIFLDFFRAEEVESMDVEGLQMIITFTAVEKAGIDSIAQDYICMRVWRVVTKRSGQKLPRVELEEIGPRVDFKLGRVRVPDEDRYKAALKQAKVAEVRSPCTLLERKCEY